MNDSLEVERLEDVEIRERLAHEALVWRDVLGTPSGREFFMDILRYLGFGQPAFNLDDRKEVAATALKDAADSLFARAMEHDSDDAVDMLKEFY